MSFEEELKRVDHEIRKLKIQFDLYFVGANPKPPTDQRDALDKTIKQMQAGTKSVADRFLYSSLVNKFNAFSELWNKILKNKEEGARVHPAAARAAQQSALQETGGTLGPPLDRGGNGHAGGHGRPHRPGGAGGRKGAGKGGDDLWRVPIGGDDPGVVKNLYDSYIAAKNRAGDARKPSYETFAREIARHVATLKGKANCQTIDFTIYSADNKVSIKGKPGK